MEDITESNIQSALCSLHKFFLNASDSDFENTILVGKELDRFGASYVVLGLSCLIIELRDMLATQNEGLGARVFSPQVEYEADQKFVRLAYYLLNDYAKLIKAYERRFIRQDGFEILIASILSSNDEDVITLAAFILTSGILSGLYPVNPNYILPITQAYNKAYGTGCKISLALCLKYYGEEKYFESVKTAVFSYLYPNEKYRLLSEKDFVSIVWNLICLDIASEGRASSKFYGWKRLTSG
jgi:hypothetical protein